ncbi:hypothetical protein GCM10027298_05680 [Epidermidibacterium keratini]
MDRADVRVVVQHRAEPQAHHRPLVDEKDAKIPTRTTVGCAAHRTSFPLLSSLMRHV